MSTYQSPVDQKIATLMTHYGITGTITAGGPTSRVYDASSRVFSVELEREDRRDCFAVYIGTMHPDIDLGFALRWLLDTASHAEEESYERWLAEDGTFYLNELGEEGARAFYEESHEVGHKLRNVLGEQVYSALAAVIQ
ncbi:MAG: hypothetical protein ACRDIV_17515 [Ktedonobacteraceae bacterium]